MKALRGSKWQFAQLIGIMSIFLQSCGLRLTPTASTACPANTVVFNISDSSVVRVCGCTEAQNTSLVGAQTATICTAPISTLFKFNFISTTQNHVISVFNTALNQTVSSNQTLTYSSTASGTFAFNDSVSSVSGNIVITP